MFVVCLIDDQLPPNSFEFPQRCDDRPEKWRPTEANHLIFGCKSVCHLSESLFGTIRIDLGVMARRKKRWQPAPRLCSIIAQELKKRRTLRIIASNPDVLRAPSISLSIEPCRVSLVNIRLWVIAHL